MKPAIFNTAMVRAILDGRKTQTRRACTNIVEKDYGFLVCSKPNRKGHITPLKEFDMACKMAINHYAPYKVGDIIYVRETFKTFSDITMDKEIGVIYKADNETKVIPCECNRTFEYATYDKWKPSIHMPKEYARLFLRVKDVRIERLNEIEYDDVLSEGFPIDSYEMKQTDKLYSADMHGEVDFEEDRAFEWFTNLWESIYGNGSFDNRYVWVIEFEKISKEEAI